MERRLKARNVKVTLNANRAAGRKSALAVVTQSGIPDKTKGVNQDAKLRNQDR
jgi:hypothetical protein